MTLGKLLRWLREKARPARQREVTKVARSEAVPNRRLVPLPPLDPSRPAVFVVSEDGIGEVLDASLGPTFQVRRHQDTYRFLADFHAHVRVGGEVVAVVVGQVVPRFLFLTVLMHLEQERAMVGVPVIFLNGSTQLAVFLDGELRHTRPLTPGDRNRILAETVTRYAWQHLGGFVGVSTGRRTPAAVLDFSDPQEEVVH